MPIHPTTPTLLLHPERVCGICDERWSIHTPAMLGGHVQRLWNGEKGEEVSSMTDREMDALQDVDDWDTTHSPHLRVE